MSRAPTVPARQQQQDDTPAVLEPRPGTRFRKMIEESESRLAEILPKYMTPARIIRLSLMAYNRKKDDLDKCDPVSVLNCVMTAAQFGFEVDSILGHAYLIPYNEKQKDGSCIKVCQLQIGYKGFLELARRSREFKAIEAVEVFEKDVFRVVRNPFPRVKHVLSLDDNPGKMTHVYACAETRAGGVVFELMTRGDVERYRASSKQPGSLMWTKYFGEGAKKTAIKRMLKRQPMTIEIADLIAYDDDLNGDARIGHDDEREHDAIGNSGLRKRLSVPRQREEDSEPEERGSDSSRIAEESREEQRSAATEEASIDVTGQEQAPEPVQEAPKAVQAVKPTPEPEPVGPSDVPVWGQPDTPIDPRPYNEVVKGAVVAANVEIVELAIGTEMEKNPPKITEAIVHTVVHDALVAAKLAAEPKKQLMTSDKKIVISPLYKGNKDLIRSTIMNGVEAQCREAKKTLGVEPEPLADDDINELAEISEEASDGEVKE